MFTNQTTSAWEDYGSCCNQRFPQPSCEISPIVDCFSEVKWMTTGTHFGNYFKFQGEIFSARHSISCALWSANLEKSLCVPARLLESRWFRWLRYRPAVAGARSPAPVTAVPVSPTGPPVSVSSVSGTSATATTTARGAGPRSGAGTTQHAGVSKTLDHWISIEYNILVAFLCIYDCMYVSMLFPDFSKTTKDNWKITTLYVRCWLVLGYTVFGFGIHFWFVPKSN